MNKYNYPILTVLLAATCQAEVSLYRGLATTHIFMSNDYVNNDNSVTILKVDDVLVGSMVNSYGEPGYFFGYQPKVWESERWEAYAGITAVTGYKRWQVPYYRNTTYQNAFESVIAGAPIGSLSYSFNDHISVQLNTMFGFVWNAGVRIDF